MTWSTRPSDRAKRLPLDWESRRRRVLHRDGHRCRATHIDGSRCDMPASDVDHIIAGDDHSEANLQSLCRWHHARKSSAEGQAARGPREKRTRAPETHPGSL